MNSQSWEMLTMAFKSKKKMIKLWNSECGNGEDGLQIKNLSNWKIQSVENDEDGLQIKNWSNW